MTICELGVSACPQAETDKAYITFVRELYAKILSACLKPKDRIIKHMKYHKIKTLGKGWHDKDEILLHAVFQVLTDFVEQEKPETIIDRVINIRHFLWT